MVKIPPTKNQPGAPFLPLALPAFAFFFAAAAFFEDSAFPFEETAEALGEIFEDCAFSFAETGFDVPTFVVAVVLLESKDGLGVVVVDFAVSGRSAGSFAGVASALIGSLGDTRHGSDVIGVNAYCCTGQTRGTSQ